MNLVFNKLSTDSDTIKISYDGGVSYKEYNTDTLKKSMYIPLSDDDCEDISLIRIRGHFKKINSVDAVLSTDIEENLEQVVTTAYIKEYVAKNTINSDGTAQYAKVLKQWAEKRQSQGNISPVSEDELGCIKWQIVSSTMTDEGRPNEDGYLISFFWDIDRWDSQLFIPNGSESNYRLKVRYFKNDSWTDWYELALREDYKVLYQNDANTCIPEIGETRRYQVWIKDNPVNFPDSSHSWILTSTTTTVQNETNVIRVSQTCQQTTTGGASVLYTRVGDSQDTGVTYTWSDWNGIIDSSDWDAICSFDISTLS